MNKTAYKVNPDFMSIIPVPYTDLDGVSWREAKKQLRNLYLVEARALRSMTEKTYFGPETT